MVGCGEKIKSEDGQRIRFERGAIFYFLFFVYWVLWLSGFKEKKSEFLYFFLNDADVENCGASRGFGYILYIYIYID